MIKTNYTKKDMKIFSGPKEVALTLATFIFPGVGSTYKKLDQHEIEYDRDRAAHTAKVEPTRERVDTRYKKKDSASSSPSPDS